MGEDGYLADGEKGEELVSAETNGERREIDRIAVVNFIIRKVKIVMGAFFTQSWISPNHSSLSSVGIREIFCS